jgi:hypothetical protein
VIFSFSSCALQNNTLGGLGFELSALGDLLLEPKSSSFCSGYCGNGVLLAICPGWSQTMTFLILAFQAVRITDVSHWHPAQNNTFCLIEWIQDKEVLSSGLLTIIFLVSFK